MITVMIVDSSAIVRSALQELLQRSSDIRVTAMVPDLNVALSKMIYAWPDVIIADIEMSHMDGVTFIRQVMDMRPTLIVICSSLTQSGSTSAFKAIEAGAFSVIAKPMLNITDFFRTRSDEIVNTVRAAALANMQGHITTQKKIVPRELRAVAVRTTNIGRPVDRVIAISISIGGAQALEHVLTRLPADTHGLIVIQNMPMEFTRHFTNRLNKRCQLEIKEAENGDCIRPGRALIASNDRQVKVKQCGLKYCVEVVDSSDASSNNTSADVLFSSLADVVGANALGIVMTGMGNDGARGLKKLFECGAQTAAQDEATSVVYGMPKEAVKLCAAQHVVSLYDFPEYICQFSR